MYSHWRIHCSLVYKNSINYCFLNELSIRTSIYVLILQDISVLRINYTNLIFLTNLIQVNVKSITFNLLIYANGYFRDVSRCVLSASARVGNRLCLRLHIVLDYFAFGLRAHMALGRNYPAILSPSAHCWWSPACIHVMKLKKKKYIKICSYEASFDCNPFQFAKPLNIIYMY